MKQRFARGFTLIELLIVIALIAALAAAVIVALNPARIFAQSRNSERWSHVSTLSNAIQQNAAENRGVFTCAIGGTLPSTSTVMASAAGYNICDCLAPNFLASLPFDPGGTGSYTSCSSYNTGYEVMQNASSGRITVSAPEAELGSSISVLR